MNLRPQVCPAVVLRPATALLAVLWLATSWVCPQSARGEDASAPAILQIFEAKWTTIEDRMADIHNIGYGRLWVPPPTRAGSGFSVGYDVFDRFDLGGPGHETHYGTSDGFKAMVQSAHSASVLVNPDWIWNHNGVGNRTDANFVSLGGYPGFALTLPGDIDGDFHNPFIDALSDDQILGHLAGLNDIAQEKNHQFIRQPVAVGDPNNIPAGTVYNQPDPNNARFYPDIDQGGTTVFNPKLGQNVTLYDFNAADPLAGDPVVENATGLLMRNLRWFIQEYDVDGFRLDAARHFPRWVLDNYFDQAAFLAKTEPLLDGSPQHVFSFIETGGDSAGFIQDFIRKDIDNNNLGSIGGNRDVLDFNLFYALRNNLSGNGQTNNWHTIKNASIDLNDDGQRNGSQGVSFVQSHDEQGAFLTNVAYAYTLMMPGNALVYTRAEEFGDPGNFPQPGKTDALGGFYGETITKLVELRNSHGRGDFRERWLDDAFNPNGFSNVYVYERSNSAVVGLNSRNDSVVETRTVQTDFAPGTVLVELTGNAADPTVDPGGTIPEAVRVNGSGQASISIPANAGHGRGYVIYGVAAPQGAVSLTNIASTIPGATPSAANNGTARLADIDVITGDSFQVQLATTPVTLPAPAGESSPVRDVHADGDYAVLKFDGGIDLNGNAAVDHVAPNSVTYGFEEFGDVNSPGFVWDGGANIGSGSGAFAQTIDATALAEGRHYLTVRAFRHRDAATGGDGGPAVFTDFTRTIYIDRLKPEAALVSFDPFASSPNNQANRDLIVESTDGTANSMHFFLDLAAGKTEAEIMAMVNAGQGKAGQYDRDAFKYGYTGVKGGNHAVTIVTLEESGNFNVQRFTGIVSPFGPTIGLAAGFGDLTGNGLLQTNDLVGLNNNSFEDVLYSQNAKFHAAADVNADGLVTDVDLFALGDELVAAGAPAATLDAYDALLVRRGNVDGNSVTDGDDAAAIYAAFGQTDWTKDLDADGVVGLSDVATLVDQAVRTSRADFDLSRAVDGGDFLTWQRGYGGGVRFDQGDADLGGSVDGDDLATWMADFGQQAPIGAAAVLAAATVPEPTAVALAALAAAGVIAARHRHAIGPLGRRPGGKRPETN
ncbi:MAG: hypothetical protein KDA44_08910 [Planctomycetales bacterium]|nr:hypothetical protein [Planctomycetales bacterium]